MTRAAIYVRTSRDREGGGLGVARQEQDCRQLAARHGLTAAQVYSDNDLSAYSGKPRPSYRRMLDDIAAARVDAVLAWHTDRLHRSPTELEEYITACEPRGVPTYTVKAGPLDLSAPSGRMVARQLGAVARYEVEHQVERQQRAKLQAAADGKWGGGRRPYGYEPDGVTLRPAEARAVAEATDAILSGASVRSQAAAMNARGLVTSTGRPWTPQELRKVLLRARNAGLREHRGEVVGPAAWPPLVDEDRWRALVSVLTHPGRRTQWSSARRWLLSGLALCGVCGSPVRATLLNSTRGGVPSYTCKVAKCVVRNAAELDQHVGAVVVARLSRPDVADLLAASGQPDSGVLQLDATSLRERLDGLAAAYADGAIDVRQLREGSERLRVRLAEVEEQMAAAGRGEALAGLVGATDPAAAWDALDLHRRRAVVDTLLTVTINRTRKGRPPGWTPGNSYFDPRTVEITWKG
ncbi:DNA invertase Pin-like site-specific DNA recombinase [Micromonospora kangleipakensis]|uniref:DNA invertase Pin-like site-specific DNA recombinase n=1 Tax=Micromonospora kangleipakensis TaxID=1077942 RepID=A0A4Q8B8H5_9ACTN|nr:recombinase family protein [Micromonospora kangleipakensis]RZU73980.1 DNA invertase Pin-like site-specific DNA recombinase [Micromonospora kangleipakensis]